MKPSDGKHKGDAIRDARRTMVHELPPDHPGDFESIRLEGGELGDTYIEVTPLHPPYANDDYHLLHLGGKGEPGCKTVALSSADMKALMRWMGKGGQVIPKGVQRQRAPDGYAMLTEELEDGNLRFSYDKLSDEERGKNQEELARIYRR